jgi:ribosomal-protein-alanine N-acetyltransferase
MAIIVESKRLQLREFCCDDTAYILRQLNEPSFIKNIADRGVRNEQQAKQHIVNGPLASYLKHGFGLWAVQLKSTDAVIGTCGLNKRDNLTDVDLGYALLPEHFGKGYAEEATLACIQVAKNLFHLPRLLAIVNPNNSASRKLLEKIGFQYQSMIAMYDNEPEICKYKIELNN